MLKSILKKIVFNNPVLLRKYLLNKEKKGHIFRPHQLEAHLSGAEKVLLKASASHIKVGLIIDEVPFVKKNDYITTRAYYPKYENFFKNNNIKYQHFDILTGDWIEQAKKFNLIIWHTFSDPATQEMAFNKLYFLEKKMGIACYPSVDELWSYENKINMHYLFQHFQLPEIPTFVSFSREDALIFAEKASYPLISKIATGSASYGVEKLDSKKKALALINKAFSDKGIPTYFSYLNQKNYVLFQEFIDDADFDLRIMVVGNKLFGYYRYPNKGDFKASGAGNYEKKEIPIEALELAYKCKQLFGSIFLATDLLFSKSRKQYYIIESSIFIGIDTTEQLVVEDKPGYYERVNENEYVFKEGRFWMQELVLQKLFDSN